MIPILPLMPMVKEGVCAGWYVSNDYNYLKYTLQLKVCRIGLKIQNLMERYFSAAATPT